MAREAGGDFPEVEFSVPSMVCDGSADKIRRKLTALPGVEAVKPRLWRKRVWVRFDPSKVEDAQICAALDAAGYRAARISE